MISRVRFVQRLCPGGVLLNPSQVGLTCLRDLAFDNIKSQLCEANIIKELFSVFTARQVISYFVMIRLSNNLSAQPQVHHGDGT